MIGIFDSGFGGLSTLKELLKILPEYDYIYLGDSARTPYGGRSQETVTSFTEECVNELFDRGVEITLIACNTASSDALRFLQKKYLNRKILGVLIPAAEVALEETRFGRIGIAGTRGTIQSRNYEKEIKKLYPKIYQPKDKRARKIPEVHTQSCPLLVPLIEEGWQEKPESRMILRKYLKPLKDANIDTLILGCTHYPLMEKSFKRKIGKRCKVINSSKAQAEKFADYLEKHSEIKSKLKKTSKLKFLTTDDKDRFIELGSKFLDKKISKKDIEKISF